MTIFIQVFSRFLKNKNFDWVPAFGAVLTPPNPVGLTTNWCSFYKPVKISNLKMINVLPHFMVSSHRIFGCNMAYEDGIVIFKMNDEEIGCSIISGSSRISEKLLDQQEMLLEKLVPPFDVTK